MKQTYYPAQHFQAKVWANGTTTELVKFPVDSDFLKRDFIFRISTATVEAEESTFSDFSGLTRREVSFLVHTNCFVPSPKQEADLLYADKHGF